MTKEDDQAQRDFVVLAIDNLHNKVLSLRDWADSRYNPDELADWVADVARLVEDLELVEYQIENETWGDEND